MMDCSLEPLNFMKCNFEMCKNLQNMCGFNLTKKRGGKNETTRHPALCIYFECKYSQVKQFPLRSICLQPYFSATTIPLLLKLLHYRFLIYSQPFVHNSCRHTSTKQCEINNITHKKSMISVKYGLLFSERE
jgi:hypothetical protein